eukprot:scaffold1659_cov371-Prasinococcus_capsulatus_cf.AAC.13
MRGRYADATGQVVHKRRQAASANCSPTGSVGPTQAHDDPCLHFAVTIDRLRHWPGAERQLRQTRTGLHTYAAAFAPIWSTANMRGMLMRASAILPSVWFVAICLPTVCGQNQQGLAELNLYYIGGTSFAVSIRHALPLLSYAFHVQTGSGPHALPVQVASVVGGTSAEHKLKTTVVGNSLAAFPTAASSAIEPSLAKESILTAFTVSSSDWSNNNNIDAGDVAHVENLCVADIALTMFIAEQQTQLIQLGAVCLQSSAPAPTPAPTGPVIEHVPPDPPSSSFGERTGEIALTITPSSNAPGKYLIGVSTLGEGTKITSLQLKLSSFSQETVKPFGVNGIASSAPTWEWQMSLSGEVFGLSNEPVSYVDGITPLLEVLVPGDEKSVCIPEAFAYGNVQGEENVFVKVNTELCSIFSEAEGLGVKVGDTMAQLVITDVTDFGSTQVVSVGIQNLQGITAVHFEVVDVFGNIPEIDSVNVSDLAKDNFFLADMAGQGKGILARTIEYDAAAKS